MAGNYERLEDEVGRETPLFVESGSDFQSIFQAIAAEYDRLDSDHTTVAEQTHVDTATGSELEYIGQLVGVTRRANETDDQLRQRIKIRGGAAVSSGTTDEVMKLAKLAFEADYDDLSFSTDFAQNPGEFSIVSYQTPSSSTVLTEATLETELENAVPYGHRVTVNIRTSIDGEINSDCQLSGDIFLEKLLGGEINSECQLSGSASLKHSISGNVNSDCQLSGGVEGIKTGYNAGYGTNYGNPDGYGTSYGSDYGS